MISAVDTNVLLDFWQPDPNFGPASALALRTAYDEGALVVCEVVYAEVAPHFPTRDALDRALGRLAIRLQSLGPEAAWRAGRAWVEYRRRGGTRSRIMADFLIGAHAVTCAERLVTRDKGFYGQSFPDLVLLDPAGG